MRDDGVREIAPAVGDRQLAIVNVVFYGPPSAGDWPPTYFTPDWHAARDSVRALAALPPKP